MMIKKLTALGILFMASTLSALDAAGSTASDDTVEILERDGSWTRFVPAAAPVHRCVKPEPVRPVTAAAAPLQQNLDTPRHHTTAVLTTEALAYMQQASEVISSIDLDALSKALPYSWVSDTIRRRHVKYFFENIGIQESYAEALADTVDLSKLPPASTIRSSINAIRKFFPPATSRANLVQRAICETIVCAPLCCCYSNVCTPCVACLPCTCCCCIKETILGYTVIRTLCYLKSFLEIPE